MKNELLLTVFKQADYDNNTILAFDDRCDTALVQLPDNRFIVCDMLVNGNLKRNDNLTFHVANIQTKIVALAKYINNCKCKCQRERECEELTAYRD